MLERNVAGGTRYAIQDLERAVQLGTVQPEDYELLARLLHQKGDFVGAISILRSGIALDPYIDSYYAPLTGCYEAQGNFKDARRALQNGLHMFPEDLSLRKALDKLDAQPTHDR